jgi:hypothetical protein
MIKFWNCKFLRNRRSGVYIVCRDRFIFLFCAQWARLQPSGGVCVWVHKWFIYTDDNGFYVTFYRLTKCRQRLNQLLASSRTPPLQLQSLSAGPKTFSWQNFPPPSLFVHKKWRTAETDVTLKGNFVCSEVPWQKEWENNDETALHPDLRGWRWIVQ